MPRKLLYRIFIYKFKKTWYYTTLDIEIVIDCRFYLIFIFYFWTELHRVAVVQNSWQGRIDWDFQEDSFAIASAKVQWG